MQATGTFWFQESGEKVLVATALKMKFVLSFLVILSVNVLGEYIFANII